MYRNPKDMGLQDSQATEVYTPFSAKEKGAEV